MNDGWLPQQVIEEPFSEEYVRDRLKKLGYDKLSDKFSVQLREFQGRYCLPVNGKPDDPRTQRELFKPRICAFQDIMEAQEQRCEWPHKEVTITHRIRLDNLTRDQIDGVVQRVVKSMNSICGLRMEFIDNENDANLLEVEKRIDGRGGVLARHYLPCGVDRNDQLRGEYDTSEDWSVQFLFNVLWHEVGHGLGLDHGPCRTNGTKNMMCPTANGATKPGPWDIRELVKRYDKNTDPDEPDEPDDPTPGGESVLSGKVNGRSMMFVGWTI